MIEGLSTERLQASFNRIAGSTQDFANSISDSIAQLPFDLVDSFWDGLERGDDILRVLLDTLADFGREITKQAFKGVLNDLFTSPATNVPTVARSTGGQVIAAAGTDNPLLGAAGALLPGEAVPVTVVNLPTGGAGLFGATGDITSADFIGPPEPPTLAGPAEESPTETVEGFTNALSASSDAVDKNTGVWDSLTSTVKGWWDAVAQALTGGADDAASVSAAAGGGGAGLGGYVGGVLAIIGVAAQIADIILTYKQANKAFEQAQKQYELDKQRHEDAVQITPDGKVFGYIRDGGTLDKFSEGGIIRGPGTTTSDSISAYIQGKNGRASGKIMVSRDEAILNAKAVKAVGPDFVHELNARALRGSFSKGGIIGEGVSSGTSQIQKTIVNSSDNTTDERPISIALFDDRRDLEDYLASSEGENSVMQVLSRNSTQTKQIVNT